MTGREQLTMFARLRGIAEPKVAGIVAKLMQDLNFEVHADKPSDTYSGGNKRKLSTAIALIGDPQVVFLDEPTTGMDPGTRRYLWNTLMAAVKSERSIVLTSHSMEECEALCTRLAIMVDGRFQCIGTSQHLKNKFSEGYQVNLVSGRNVSDKEANVAELKKFTVECFPDAVLLEAHDLMLSYQVPAAYRWSELFEYVEQATKIYDLDSHTISQSSLEQIFLQMAHGKTDATSKKRLSQLGGTGDPPGYVGAPTFTRKSVDSSAGMVMHAI
jgi:ATP-binding cassette subfamily A (ABC1) protein 3